MQRHYSPLVAPDTDGLMLDITGAAIFLAAKKPWLKEMVRKLAAVGIGASIAAAQPMARHMRGAHCRQSNLSAGRSKLANGSRSPAGFGTAPSG